MPTLNASHHGVLVKGHRAHGFGNSVCTKIILRQKRKECGRVNGIYVQSVQRAKKESGKAKGSRGPIQHGVPLRGHRMHTTERVLRENGGKGLPGARRQAPRTPKKSIERKGPVACVGKISCSGLWSIRRVPVHEYCRAR